MTNKFNEGLLIVQEKKSGLLWIFAAFCLIPLILFFLVYGICLAGKNSVVWVFGRSERKLKRLERKQARIETKEKIKQLKGGN